jgi:hypothetical protein
VQGVEDDHPLLDRDRIFDVLALVLGAAALVLEEAEGKGAGG